MPFDIAVVLANKRNKDAKEGDESVNKAVMLSLQYCLLFLLCPKRFYG